MKQAIILVTAALFLGACALYQTTPPEQSVCATMDAQGSVICTAASKAGLTVEDINIMLLDATIVGWATTDIRADEVIRAIDRISTIINLNEPKGVTLKAVTDLVIQESKKSAALAAVLSRHLKTFADVEQPLLSYDFYLINKHLEYQRAQFGG